MTNDHREEEAEIKDEKLLAVAITFAATMGWIDSPGGGEWDTAMREDGGPAAFLAHLHTTLKEFLACDVGDACCGVEDLEKLQEKWEWRGVR